MIRAPRLSGAQDTWKTDSLNARTKTREGLCRKQAKVAAEVVVAGADAEVAVVVAAGAVAVVHAAQAAGAAALEVAEARVEVQVSGVAGPEVKAEESKSPASRVAPAEI